MIYKVLNKAFGWDYIGWKNSVASGVARVYVDGAGRVFYWRYKHTKLIDFITERKTVVWLTCPPEKYIKELEDT